MPDVYVSDYLRNTFDKLGVWGRLELAIFVAGHGGARWQAEVSTLSEDDAPEALSRLT